LVLLYILQVIIGRKTTADRAGEGKYFWMLEIKLKKTINIPGPEILMHLNI